jgi:hypothetical protein
MPALSSVLLLFSLVLACCAGSTTTPNQYHWTYYGAPDCGGSHATYAVTSPACFSPGYPILSRDLHALSLNVTGNEWELKTMFLYDCSQVANSRNVGKLGECVRIEALSAWTIVTRSLHNTTA